MLIDLDFGDVSATSWVFFYAAYDWSTKTAKCTVISNDVEYTATATV